jgi:hypothetical protein
MLNAYTWNREFWLEVSEKVQNHVYEYYGTSTKRNVTLKDGTKCVECALPMLPIDTTYMFKWTMGVNFYITLYNCFSETEALSYQSQYRLNYNGKLYPSPVYKGWYMFDQISFDIGVKAYDKKIDMAGFQRSLVHELNHVWEDYNSKLNSYKKTGKFTTSVQVNKPRTYYSMLIKNRKSADKSIADFCRVSYFLLVPSERTAIASSIYGELLYHEKITKEDIKNTKIYKSFLWLKTMIEKYKKMGDLSVFYPYFPPEIKHSKDKLISSLNLALGRFNRTMHRVVNQLIQDKINEDKRLGELVSEGWYSTGQPTYIFNYENGIRIDFDF